MIPEQQEEALKRISFYPVRVYGEQRRHQNYQEHYPGRRPGQVL
jgi:hypothetical protein